MNLPRLWSDERIRFLLVGGFNTCMGYAVFASTYWLFRGVLSLPWILVLSYLMAVPISYATQRQLVFRSGAPVRLEAIRFAGVNTLVFLANLLFLPVVQRSSGLDPLLVQATFLVVTAIVSYCVHKWFTFFR